MMSFCGVLKTHFRLASTGSTMRAEAAIEIIGVCASATTSIIASEFGVVDRAEHDVDLVLGDELPGVGDRRRGVGGVVEDDVVDLLAADRLRHQRDRVLLRDAERRGRAGGRDGDADVDVGAARAWPPRRGRARRGSSAEGHAVSPLLGGGAKRERAASARGALTAPRPPKNRSATTGAMSAWLSAPSRLQPGEHPVHHAEQQHRQRLVQPGVAQLGARRGDRVGEGGDDLALAAEHAAPVGRRAGSARPRSGRGARSARRRRRRGRRSISAPHARLGRQAAPRRPRRPAPAAARCGPAAISHQQLVLVAHVVVERRLARRRRPRRPGSSSSPCSRGARTARAARARIVSRWQS